MVTCSYWNGTKWATDTFKWDWIPGSTTAGTPSAEGFITMGGPTSGYTFMVDPAQIPNNGHVYKQIQLQYYTEADYSTTANSTISNTAEYNTIKSSPTTPNTGIPNLGTPQKTVVLGTDYLEYTLLFDMPVAMYKQNFYITDTLTLGKDLNPNYRTDQGTGGKAPTLVSVEAVDKNNGTVLQAFTPGGTGNFAVHLNPGNEGAFTLFFKNNWQGGSSWWYNGDSTLKIVYRVALDTVLWEDRNLAAGSQRTVADVLIKNAASNIVYGIYGAQPAKAESTLVVTPGMDKKFLSDKTQVQSDGSVLFYYQVEVNVYDPNTGNRYFTAQDMQGFTFSDDFENNLSYEPNTLKVETYSYNTTNKNYTLNSTYNANGKAYSDPMVVPVTDLQDGSGAAFADFLCDKLVFTYALRLDASEILKNPMVVYPINNTATFENPGGTKKLSDQCKESYNSKLIDKTADPTLTDGNVIKFQIEINPKAMDLDPQSNTLTVEDTLGKVLEYRNGSMVVEESTDGGTTWTKLTNGTDWTTVVKTGGFDVTVPDQRHVRITYECNIITLGNAVSVENTAKIKGMNNLSVAFKANFKVLYIGGNVSTSTEYIYVKKEDKVTGDGVGNVWYDVYVKDHDIGDQSPSVVPYKITINGDNYYWFTDCETNAGGLMKIEGRDYNLPGGTQQKNILTSGRLYVVRERTAPAGYLLGDDVFFWYDTKPATATDNYNVYQKSDKLAFTILEVPVAEAQLKVKKTLTGGISNEIFTFTITPVTQGAPLPTDTRGNKVVAASVSGAGTATFERIQFTDKGTYEYTVVETAPAVKTPGMKYDTNTWTVRYTVDVVNKLLSVTKTEYLLNGVSKSEVEFINDITYDIYVSKRDLGGKELSGAKLEITGTEKGTAAPITKIEWTSDGTNKKVSLRAGDYVLHEVAAPKNYKVAADIKFTVDDYGKVTITSTSQTVGTTTTGDPLIVMTDDYLGYGHINIKKTVTGDLGDKTKDFTFRINLGSDQSFKYTGSKSGTVKNGDTITLKHNESVTILDIPIGVTYEIIESGNEGYKVTATNSKGVIETRGQIISVSYVNDKTSSPKPQEETDDGGKPKPTKPVPDTGDSSMLNVYIIMALAAVLSVGIISLRGFRRKTKISGKHKD